MSLFKPALMGFLWLLLLCRVRTRRPAQVAARVQEGARFPFRLELMAVAAPPPVEGGWQYRLLMEKQRFQELWKWSAASSWGSSASSICPAYNNQILFCIGCKADISL